MEHIWKPHVTVAAIIEDNGRFLMVEEISDGVTVYNQPAGHLEADETLIDAVIRETMEETAWQFSPLYLSGIYNWKHPASGDQFLRFTFYGNHLEHNKKQKLDNDIIRALWLTRDELAAEADKLRSPMVLTCIDDYLNGNQYPLQLLKDIR